MATKLDQKDFALFKELFLSIEIYLEALCYYVKITPTNPQKLFAARYSFYAGSPPHLKWPMSKPVDRNRYNWITQNQFFRYHFLQSFRRLHYFSLKIATNH
jgi:hypothetical protein